MAYDTTDGHRRQPVAAFIGVALVFMVGIAAGFGGGIAAAETSVNLDSHETSEQQGNFEVSIDSTNSPIEVGERLTVTVEVVNTFDADDTKDITLVVGDTERDSVQLTLEGGDSETVTLEWQTESGDAGEYEVVVSSEDDNDSTIILVEAPPDPAHFSVNVVAVTSPVEPGDPISIEAEITNTGDEAAGQEITLVVGGTERDSVQLTLEGGDSETVTLEWQTESGDAGEYEAVVSSTDDSDSTVVTVEEPSDPAHFSVKIVEVTSPVEPGDPITVEAEITNTGDEAADQEIELLVDGVRVDDPVDVSLAGGESQVLVWETTVDESGSFEFVVSSADDTDSTVVSVEEPPVGPQLEIAILDSTYDRESDRYTTLVRVTNTGDEPGSAEVELLIDGEPFSDSVIGEPADPVEPGESTDLELTWANPDLEPGTYQLSARTSTDSDTTTVTIETRDEGVEPVDEGEEPVDEGVEPVDEGVEPVDEGEEPVDEGVEPVEDDDLSMIPIVLAIGGVLVLTGALLYRRRRPEPTSNQEAPRDGAVSTGSVSEPGVISSTTADRDASPPDDAESESLRSVPVPPPTGEDDCEDEREKFAAMLADLEQAVADAASAKAEAEAAAEAAEAARTAAEEAAEAADAAEATREEVKGNLESAEERKAELTEEIEEAEEELKWTRKSHRHQVREAQRLYRLRDDAREEENWTAYGHYKNHVIPKQHEKVNSLSKKILDEEDALEALKEELEEIEEALDEAQERLPEAEAEAEAKREEAEAAEGEAQEAAEAAEAAAEAAEAAAEKADALLEEAKAAAEEYGECVEGCLDELEARAEEARERAGWGAKSAEYEKEDTKEHARKGDKAAEEAFPEGDPVSAAGEEYEKGKRKRDAAEAEAEWAEGRAEEAKKVAEETEELREALKEFREGLRERGLPGADDIPSGDETAEKTREAAERAGDAAEAGRRSAEEASEVFSQCEEGETKPTGEVYVERSRKPHDSEPVEVEYGPWVYDGASDWTDQGERVKQAIEGMSTVFRRLNQVVSGDVAKALLETTIEMFDGDVDESTQEELEGYIEFLLEESGADTELKGKAGIPAQYYGALFSAAEELFEGFGGLREQIRENRDLGDLEIRVPVLYTERKYAVEMVCIDGRWVKRVGDFIEEETRTEIRRRNTMTKEHLISEAVREFIDDLRRAGKNVKPVIRSKD